LFTSQVPSTIEYFSTVSEVEEHPEDGDSTANVESHAEYPRTLGFLRRRTIILSSMELLLTNIKSLTMI
jgi:hypothetical protein